MSLQIELLRKHVQEWQAKLAADPLRAEHDKQERADRVAYYRAQSPDKLRAMSDDELYEYISKLWAMPVWGNKKYVVDKLVGENGSETVKANIAELVWGDAPIEQTSRAVRSRSHGPRPTVGFL